jgi:hypothetical protein
MKVRIFGFGEIEASFFVLSLRQSGGGQARLDWPLRVASAIFSAGLTSILPHGKLSMANNGAVTAAKRKFNPQGILNPGFFKFE